MKFLMHNSGFNNNNSYDDFFKTLRDRSIKVDKSVDIDKIMNCYNEDTLT